MRKIREKRRSSPRKKRQSGFTVPDDLRDNHEAIDYIDYKGPIPPELYALVEALEASLAATGFRGSNEKRAAVGINHKENFLFKLFRRYYQTGPHSPETALEISDLWNAYLESCKRLSFKASSEISFSDDGEEW